jgi:ABC-2 type transport system ATP-binding protein/lipopolysaccharide transport system ATP-binding protein
MADTPAIKVDHVSKRFRLYNERAGSLKELVTKRRLGRYSDFWAVDDVSLEVPHGSVYGLVGHNGSGKSTLLKMMANIHKPTKGTITTDGRISALLELGAGFHPDLSGRENIYLNAAILGLRRAEVDAIFDDIVDFSGLSEFIDSPVRHYSSGMFVRLGFSVAVHVDPQILIVDEVIAVGDEGFQRRCFEHLYKLRSNGVTIVMVTHSLNLVRQMCDRAAWLDHGVMMAEGDAADVVHEYVDKVNTAENERLEAADRARRDAEADLADRARPVAPTLRPIVLGEIEALDGDLRSNRMFGTFGPMTVRIHYECLRPVETPLFSMTFESQSGVLVAWPGMQPTHQPGQMHDGRGHVDYTIPSLSLGPGEYSVTVAVHDHDATAVLDKKERVVTFRVATDEPVFGLVDLMGEWGEMTAREEDPS